MRFDIYGRYQLEVVRESECWVAYRFDLDQLQSGKRRLMSNFSIPSSMNPNEVQVYLDDMLHEFAGPEDAIRRLD